MKEKFPKRILQQPQKKEGSEENKILQYPEFPLVVFLNHFPLIGFFIAISVALGKYIYIIIITTFLKWVRKIYERQYEWVCEEKETKRLGN